MKYGKKILAAALAALLALSVLTACSGGSIKIDGDKLAESMSDFLSSPVEYDSSLDRIAKNAMKAVRAEVGKTVTDGSVNDVTITMDNAIKGNGGTLLRRNENNTEAEFTNEGKGLKDALELDPGQTNEGKALFVSLVDARYLKDEPEALAKLAYRSAVISWGSSSGGTGTFYWRMGYYESSNYMLLVIVGETK